MSRTYLFDERWLKVAEDPHGVPYVVCEDGAMCVPLNTDGEVLFAVERSPLPHLQAIYMLPGGAIALGEQPAMTANREMQEEIGLRAENIRLLSIMQPWKYLKAQHHVYIAWGLTPSKLQGDEDYEITIANIPLNNFEPYIQSGQIIDATAIAALYLARDYVSTHQIGFNDA